MQYRKKVICNNPLEIGDHLNLLAKFLYFMKEHNYHNAENEQYFTLVYRPPFYGEADPMGYSNVLEFSWGKDVILDS